MRGSKTGATIGKQFFLDSKFCEHFIERYKTDSPYMYSHVSIDHCMEDENYEDYWVYECEDKCVSNEWYSEENLRAVVDAFNRWGEA